MSVPAWQPSSGPPPGVAKPVSRGKPRRVKVQTKADWAPPIPGTAVIPDMLPPPPSLPRTRQPPLQGARTCLERRPDAQLTDCGRSILGVPITTDINEVTCDFCLWRIERGTAGAKQ